MVIEMHHPTYLNHNLAFIGMKLPSMRQSVCQNLLKGWRSFPSKLLLSEKWMFSLIVEILHASVIYVIIDSRLSAYFQNLLFAQIIKYYCQIILFHTIKFYLFSPTETEENLWKNLYRCTFQCVYSKEHGESCIGIFMKNIVFHIYCVKWSILLLCVFRCWPKKLN